MISLLKTFGKGLLYVIGAPFFIVALVLFGAIGLLAFIFQIIKSVIYFFTGQKFFPELAEDKKLRLMKEEANKANQPVKEDNSSAIISPIFEEEKKEPEPAPIFVQRSTPEPTIEESVFEDTSSLEDFIDDEPEQNVKEEDELELEKDDDEVQEEEHTVLETSKEEVEEDEFEELETYVPRSSNYNSNDEDEDNDTSTGVDINYDL